MRQAGVLAAAGIVALDEVLPKLPEDHAKAKALAKHMAGLSAFEVDLEHAVTNIVMVRVRLPLTAQCVGETLKSRGVLCHVLPPDRIRFVTHQDISEAGLTRTLEALKEPF